MKIAIIGYSGAGKSTLAKAFGEKYGCPVLYLDTVQFQAGWKERDREEARRMVEAFLEKPAWVIDGNYGEFCHARRMEEADHIVFLNFPRLRCFRQAYGRYRQYRGRTRESMSDGCDEKFDWEFMKWLLWEGRAKSRRRRYAEICKQYAHKTTVCRNREEVEKLLSSL